MFKKCNLYVSRKSLKTLCNNFANNFNWSAINDLWQINSYTEILYIHVVFLIDEFHFDFLFHKSVFPNLAKWANFEDNEEVYCVYTRNRNFNS